MRVYQCRLQQGATATIGWIEQRGAKLGVRVELPECGGLWTVTAVYEPSFDAAALREKQRRDRKGMPTLPRRRG
jgi:hypothetical protein